MEHQRKKSKNVEKVEKQRKPSASFLTKSLLQTPPTPDPVIIHDEEDEEPIRKEKLEGIYHIWYIE